MLSLFWSCRCFLGLMNSGGNQTKISCILVEMNIRKNEVSKNRKGVSERGIQKNRKGRIERLTEK